MANGKSFGHLALVLRESGKANIPGGGSTSEKTKENRANRSSHSSSLSASSSSIVGQRQQSEAQRKSESLPELSAGIPLLLQVDPNLDIDALRHYFDFEIVSEEENGFVIVASDDTDLSGFLEAINGFAASKPKLGTATIASIHELDDDPNQSRRLKLILSDQLHELWPTLDPNVVYRVDIGVTCLGSKEIPKPPIRGKRATDAEWALKESEWATARTEAYDAWYDIQEERLSEVRRIIVDGYGGSIDQVLHDEPIDSVGLPDSFTMRVEVTGAGLKDFVLNYPFVFEVVEPDDISLHDIPIEGTSEESALPTLLAPVLDAPSVCVIDSGIQEDHVLLEQAMDKSSSYCFLPSPAVSTDVADYVPAGGHGTRVAGAVLYAEIVQRAGTYQLPFWIQNARVLDASGELPKKLFPAALLRAVVDHFHKGHHQTRIFNHSINANCHCRLKHMSAWAAEMDSLCQRYDILVVQSSGNLRRSAPAPSAGIRDHLNAGRTYPNFLTEPSSRIANPGQSLQAITVGSVAYQVYSSVGWQSFVSQQAQPSSFSRSGLGIWGVIKPEVVEFGGDYLLSPGTPIILAVPAEGNPCYPELVRSTLHGPGPAFDSDNIGTSYAAPKVAHIAAHLQELLPTEPCLLYRALIIQSARWPKWVDSTVDTSLAIRTLGYGVPDLERATTNTDYRTTYISTGETSLRSGECDVYQVRVPDSLRRPGYEYDVLIEVTLSYVAQPRRTRRNPRRYLSTWLEWKSSKLGESISSFRRRALKNEEADEDAAQGATLRWTVGSQSDHGDIAGVRRTAGTVQKDWATVKSNSLPEDFCIAAMGHQGWSKDPDSEAKYSIAVSFEIVAREIPIYDDMQVALEELQDELGIEVEAEQEIEL